ncbi:MAG TPA: aminopeptidase P family N-terminal domain-containing protein, partial [SAR324 cluster bacterium]|nr:aminopeptidase P family N-terminal domain-containing protein [SAR324 cluster bacterium]
MFEDRMKRLRNRLVEEDISVALITDDDNVYYYTGYYDYLHMEFGRPTILVVPQDGDSLLITPSMEKDMAEVASVVDRIEDWNDGLGNEWREALPQVLGGSGKVAIEPDQMPPVVRHYVESLVEKTRLCDVTPLTADMRMIKSEEELKMARHAGQVANAMMAAAHETIGDGVHEYEVALAITTAGTRMAADLLKAHYEDPRMSPN